MTAPDLSTLSARVEYAAVVLDEFNTEYSDIYNADAAWRPSELRREAGHRRAEEGEAAEKELVVQALAREVFDAQRSKYQNRHDLDSWDGAGQPRGDATDIARKLVESGWRKDDLA